MRLTFSQNELGEGLDEVQILLALAAYVPRYVRGGDVFLQAISNILCLARRSFSGRNPGPRGLSHLWSRGVSL